MKKGKNTRRHAASCAREEYQRIMSLLYVNRIPSHTRNPRKNSTRTLAGESFPLDRYFLVCGTRILDVRPRPRHFVVHRCSSLCIIVKARDLNPYRETDDFLELERIIRSKYFFLSCASMTIGVFPSDRFLNNGTSLSARKKSTTSNHCYFNRLRTPYDPAWP